MTLFKSRCYNGGNKHNFEPRYSSESTPTIYPSHTGRSSVDAIVEVVNESRHNVDRYHGDVCTWCGKVVNQQESNG